eukprot:15359969-Alexandrium_andersonii.AAC.1
MSASLVGSEMCIRDRGSSSPRCWALQPLGSQRATPRRGERAGDRARERSVSYTHLTLPTICSV